MLVSPFFFHLLPIFVCFFYLTYFCFCWILLSNLFLFYTFCWILLSNLYFCFMLFSGFFYLQYIICTGPN
ncbi:hypothetical protein VIGAN_05150600 [Vigna angularis var. angularis]|uniref:Uncharacterized protein n=1 Tax=Vigna angularis var. angularis TaxID=157739 RepID=A0A0S3S5F5_PHAAN|nr:hypothetical protein VIGAN_05150600 [Vigna angularis var. angularis]